MAMPPRAEFVLGLEELTDVDYATFVAQDTFKPEDFDIDTRDDTAQLAALMASGPSGAGDIEIGGVPAFVSYETLEETGWRIVAVAEHAAVDELTAAAGRISETVTAVVILLMIAAIALVLLLTWRARVLSIAFTRPLVAIDDATMRIARGEFRPVVPPAPLAELERTRRHLLEMGERLESAQTRMLADAEQLRENEERYRSIFENVGEAVAILDADGIVTDANEATNALVGRDPIGLSSTEMLGTEVWREPGRHTFTFDSDSGPTLVFQVTVARWGEGDATRYALTVREITAEQERQRLLEEARETAERTARLKDEFLASMSHEIRTPMNGVVGMLSLMADADLPDDARANLEVARRSAADLLVLVNDVLDMSKLEADSVSVEPADVSVREVIDGVVDLLRPLADDQSDTLVVEIDDSVPAWVHVDPTRLRQILVNLVGNALKFTDNGTVAIRVRFDDAGDGQAAEDGRGHLRVEVVDDGEGIPDEVQQRLFTRFSQGNPMGARRFRGTGLGLAIVKRLAELMGGEVGFSSQLGAGSTFWFTVAASVGAAPEPPTAVVRAASRPLRVLVAEDNAVNQMLFVKMLERLGHVAVTVGDGRQAVEAVQTDDFDVVLMDVQMPEMNGVEATHAIRSLSGPVSDIPILAITANVMAEQRSAYVAAGMTGCLPKPLTLTELAAGLADHVADPGSGPGVDPD